MTSSEVNQSSLWAIPCRTVAARRASAPWKSGRLHCSPCPRGVVDHRVAEKLPFFATAIISLTSLEVTDDLARVTLMLPHSRWMPLARAEAPMQARYDGSKMDVLSASSAPTMAKYAGTLAPFIPTPVPEMPCGRLCIGLASSGKGQCGSNTLRDLRPVRRQNDHIFMGDERIALRRALSQTARKPPSAVRITLRGNRPRRGEGRVTAFASFFQWPSERAQQLQMNHRRVLPVMPCAGSAGQFVKRRPDRSASSSASLTNTTKPRAVSGLYAKAVLVTFIARLVGWHDLDAAPSRASAIEEIRKEPT